MKGLIDSVADLTDLRDDGELEIALATTIFNQVQVVSLCLWRVIRREGQIWLRQCISLPAKAEGLNAGEEIVERPDLALSATRAERRICYESKLHLCTPPDATGTCRHLFPVIEGRNVVCLLEFLRPAPLTAEQTNLVLGLLRVYCNHSGILHHGDHDELTGLLNRRTFDESFKRIFAPKTAGGNKVPLQERRSPESECARAHLAVVDIDFFKRINDQFGHPYGDEVLVLLARLMGQCFRDTDRIFRFGGEEFLVILPDTDLAGAELAVERFREAVQNFNFSQVGRVTVSIGITAILDGDTGPNAFGRADQALYIAKHRGRNQVQCYEKLIAGGSLKSAAASAQDVEMF
jgi:diguanylate cyclase (GGDEF)-like protein